MKRTSQLWLFYLLFLSVTVYGQKGKNGSLIVSSTVTVNEYTTLTANASAGNNSITVANSSLNAHSRFSSPLSAGDLVMIIQMQGTSINGMPDISNPAVSVPNDSSWGAILNYNNCGNNEIREVASVPNRTTIILTCPLTNNYTDTGKVQVVRIPRYSNLTINSGGEITCDPWDSADGGIVAIEDSSTTTINSGGLISASALGFRGGQLINGYAPGITYFTTSADSGELGAEKGESVAGYQAGYNIYGGMYCRGAVANGGGGGNSVNSGGGGGANAGIVANWINGDGNPDTSNPNYITAWNLEYSWFSKFTSSGGGRGGYTWSVTNQNPLTVPPGNIAWSNDDRRSVGGLGGRPLDYSTGRLFLGGGGGAGQENNSDGGAGGNGGGMIYLISYGTVSGSGMILANGQNGGDDSVWPGDGPGGAGGGGTIIINSTRNISGITIEANGGTGGNQTISPVEAEGPGGGGGGGYIATTNSVTEQVNGGSNGTTLSLPAFPPNGATKGGSGITSILLAPPPTTADSAVFTYADTAFCMGDSTHFFGVAYVFSNSSPVTWSWTFSGGSPPTSVLQNPAVSYSSSGTYIVRLITSTCSNGINDTTTKKIQIIVIPLPTTVIKGTSSKCIGLKDTLTISGGTTYKWSDGSTNTTYYTGGINADSIITVIAYNSLGCSDTTHFNIMSKIPPAVSLTHSAAACFGTPILLEAVTTGTGPYTYSWSPGGQTTNNITVNDSIPTTYSVTVSNGCSITESTTVTPDIPLLSACCNGTLVLGNDTLLLANGAKSYQWSPLVNCLNPLVCDSVNVAPTATTTYTITGTDSLGCEAQRFITIVVEEPCTDLIVPNVFTPNYAGPNGQDNIFYINNTNISSWSIIIYDRWGKEVFKTTSPNQYWNGTTESGEQVPDGVYYYIINATCQGNPYKKNGFVQVIR